MNKSTRSLLMNLAIGASAILLITIVIQTHYVSSTKIKETQHTQDQPAQKATANLYANVSRNTTAENNTPHRVNVPVKIKPRVPTKDKAENSSIFINRENQKFGTAMPVYRDTMMDMLRKEAADKSPSALSLERINELEKRGDLIW